MKEKRNLTFELHQMSVIVGQPRLNADYIITMIEKGIVSGKDILIFPELCISGYLVGDIFEDESFCRDVMKQNERIREATLNSELVVIFGSLFLSETEVGEDGRRRLYNTVFAAQGGQWIGEHVKYLHPNYRIFTDTRHFYSGRKLTASLTEGQSSEVSTLEPVKVVIKGEEYSLGLMVCEDMWHKDYPVNPGKILAAKGVEVLINVSASPWTWKKNQKRHRVVKELLSDCQIPLIYVNNVGTQNNGKNIIVFDGSSTVYNRDGEVIFKAPPYYSGVFTISDLYNKEPLSATADNDTEELFKAIMTGIEGTLALLPADKRKIVIGLSGGIDSAVVAALMTYVVDKENVYAVNMPSKYNREKTKDIAKTIAQNLGISYEVIPIQEIVDLNARLVKADKGTLTYENIQARARLSILAAKAQELGGVFTSNGNKVELAFGYATLYGDLGGFLAPIADLVKREVYQLGRYLNDEIFKSEVIPQTCFDTKPSAELEVNQVDPFDYGNERRRGYHDEMVRAFTEFRLNPESFLELYDQKLLEERLQLKKGKLKKLFPTVEAFINDLEKSWKLFFNSYFKRVQSPPVIIVSKRAFGLDLLESMMSAYFTERYFRLKEKVIEKSKRIAIYGGSFNPPTTTHEKIREELAKYFDKIIIVPCGNRSDKSSYGTSLLHRRELVRLAFEGKPKVEIDFSDLDNDTFTSTLDLEVRYRSLYPYSEIRHVIGSDLIQGGELGSSVIQLKWDRGEAVWNTLKMTIIPRHHFPYKKTDLPRQAEELEWRPPNNSSSIVRSYVKSKKPLNGFVSESVAAYMVDHGLYK